MNKKRVNEWILPAKEAIRANSICDENNKVDKIFRGQIATFGAAVVMGSLKSAIAFFAEQNKSSVDRPKLIKAMYQIIDKDHKQAETTQEIFQYVCDNYSYELVEKFTDASIALKLAFNFFELVDDLPADNKDKKSDESQGDQ